MAKKQRLVREGSKRYRKIILKAMVDAVVQRNRAVKASGGDVLRIGVNEADLILALARKGMRPTPRCRRPHWNGKT